MLSSVGHSNMQLRLRITKSTHFEIFKRENWGKGKFAFKLQMKQTPIIYLRCA